VRTIKRVGGMRVFLALLALLLVGWGLSVLQDQYGPIDPTDPARTILVVNDTSGLVQVQDQSGGIPIRIAPGKTWIFSGTAWGGLHGSFLVTNVEGTTVGCMFVDLDRRRMVTVEVSSARPCG